MALYSYGLHRTELHCASAASSCQSSSASRSAPHALTCSTLCTCVCACVSARASSSAFACSALCRSACHENFLPKKCTFFCGNLRFFKDLSFFNESVVLRPFFFLRKHVCRRLGGLACALICSWIYVRVLACVPACAPACVPACVPARGQACVPANRLHECWDECRHARRCLPQ